jgi:hypothetical protein
MLPPNNEWIADICSDGTMYIDGGIIIGVVDLPKISEISIFNSFNNLLKIKLNNTFKTRINLKIYNRLGQCIISENIKPEHLSHKLDLNKLKTGIYIVNILNTRKKIYVY